MKRMKTYIFSVMTLLLLLSMITCKSESPRPNIVLIVIDTLRADHLSFYGYKNDTSPFIRKIASQNIIFNNACAASSWTAPSTASIFTSLYPFQHGVVMGFQACHRLEIKLNSIPEKLQTIPELLKKNGYMTYGISENINISRPLGFAQGFDRFIRFNYPSNRINPALKKLSDEIKSCENYFLYIHYNTPHKPYHKIHPWYKKKNNKKLDIISRYDSEINFVDDKIRQMYELFGWDKNTLLIITADHGEEFWDHNGKGHGRTLHSEVIHVPFIIQFPEKDRIQKRIKTYVHNMDILPTIRSYLNMKKEQVEEGINLIPLIHDKRKKHYRNRYLYSHLYRERSEKKDLNTVSVINKEWKLIYFRNKFKLYNIEYDPKEFYNRHEKNSDISKNLLSRFLDFEKTCKKFPQVSKKISLDEKNIEELKTLGYIK
jgi:arylsulfatase A-like enzyme